jgi:hypothetical protein
MRAFLLLGLLPALLFAQVYIEATGQTQPFTLAAGAKAAWNPAGSATETGGHSSFAAPAMSVYPNPSHSGITFKVSGCQGQTLVNIYNVLGKKVQSLDFSQKGRTSITAAMPNGIYFARLVVNSRMTQSTRFLVVR